MPCAPTPVGIRSGYGTSPRWRATSCGGRAPTPPRTGARTGTRTRRDALHANPAFLAEHPVA